MADFYTFGGLLSRIDQATDRRATLTITRTPIRLKWQGYIMCWREADYGAPKEQSLYVSVLDAA
jgi:hypothetical protein